MRDCFTSIGLCCLACGFTSYCGYSDIYIIDFTNEFVNQAKLSSLLSQHSFRSESNLFAVYFVNQIAFNKFHYFRLVKSSFLHQIISKCNKLYLGSKQMHLNSKSDHTDLLEVIGKPQSSEYQLKGRIQSIKDYIEILENDSQEAKHVQKQWEKNFYKNELKVSLTLNNFLVKIVEQKEHQIEEIFKEISQLKKKMNRQHQEKQQILSLTHINNENNPKDLNKNLNTPQRQLKEAFEAERKILGAKHTQEKEQYQKLVEKKEQILKSNKQENEYLREKLIDLGQRSSASEEQNSLLLNEIEQLKKVINDFQSNTKENDDPRKILDFSPITKRNEKQEQVQLFSFNQNTSSIFQDEDLKQQVQKLKKLLRSQQEQYAILEKQVLSLTKNKYYEELEKDCVKLTKQIAQKDEQIAEYRAIFADINQNDNKVRKLKEINEYLEADIKILKQTIKRYEKKLMDQETQQKCRKCCQHTEKNTYLTVSLEKSEQEIIILKTQLQTMINLAVAQEKEWQRFFRESGLRPQ